MKVEKVFWDNPYLSELEAKVIDVNANKIMLDRTIVYAKSGGQESDSGTINEYTIISAEKLGTQIVYTLPNEHTLTIGDNVLLKIDWEKRYRLMRLHFAAELVLELINQNFQNPRKIGANITKDKARVDFEWIGNISSTFTLLHSKIEEIVSRASKIESDYSDVENERRFWRIEDFAKVSCGGTHLKSTLEIGEICLKRINIGSNKERIEILLVSDELTRER